MIATTTINMTNDTVNAEAEVTTPDGYRKKRTINHKMKRHHSEKNLKDKHNGKDSKNLSGYSNSSFRHMSGRNYFFSS